jgi:hypothetical protein
LVAFKGKCAQTGQSRQIICRSPAAAEAGAVVSAKKKSGPVRDTGRWDDAMFKARGRKEVETGHAGFAGDENETGVKEARRAWLKNLAERVKAVSELLRHPRNQ